MAYLLALIVWLAGWWLNSRLAHAKTSDSRAISLAIPLIFGVTIIVPSPWRSSLTAPPS